MDEADLTAPTPKELAGLLQALIHEIQVDSREAIQPIFRVPVSGSNHEDDAVRAPSRSVEVNGLEPSASTLRIQTSRYSDLGICENTQLDRHFGRPLMSLVDPYSPPNRARIAHETVTATGLVRIETWATFGNLRHRGGGGGGWPMAQGPSP
jgi:hypothetical protein